MFWFAIALLLSTSGTQAQTVYKCGGTYSQTPCGPNATALPLRPNGTASLGATLKLKDEASNQTKEASEALCLAGVKGGLKDPDSAKFRGVARNGAFERPFPIATGPMTKIVSYSGYVNAKNSYGGYTGDRLFSCTLNFSEEKVLDVFIHER